MKKLWNIAFTYFLAAMAGGVFYREFTKYWGYTGETTLGYIHVHLMVLGTFTCLLLGVIAKVTNLTSQKRFPVFVKLYNIILPLMIVVMIWRGVLQTIGTELSRGMDAAISGMAGDKRNVPCFLINDFLGEEAFYRWNQFPKPPVEQ